MVRAFVLLDSRNAFHQLEHSQTCKHAGHAANWRTYYLVVRDNLYAYASVGFRTSGQRGPRRMVCVSTDDFGPCRTNNLEINMQRSLPIDSTARKGIPLFSGCIAYFAAALAGVARWSVLGNNKHNPGEPLHHARGKSMDHADCIVRHLTDIADLEAFYERDKLAIAPKPHRDACTAAIIDEADALAWRALARSQELHEKYGGAPLAPAARLPVPEGTKRKTVKKKK